ncbi:SDR family oxidoreductase [Frankia sp. CNm7]|uniref:SDR family oxidoreductase n=1 Tax=Frankia nepalensis TaxID=1836974 RepID=A0A937RVK2_9ACTN|nr:oxidoreductase [Frankia nepalensis]MBL7495941.1 SDR family oxidoreductase [Frankia nepalensis]MBL7513586.1 SDR family oxidoreductase [Frankia nepalensis]MBL7524032.1 SDR family oxidoreductase [Frankia nepalensis]MBL7632666.1 SDR family oxidoreductase [Frankia nepalensis]
MVGVPRQRRWRADDVPELSGRTAVITGANSGIGFEAAKVLAGRGVTVVLACRNPVKAQAAVDRIRAVAPEADLSTLEMDLNSLASVRKAADELLAKHSVIDLLINNAGVIMLPHGQTEDGFEQHFGINHLAHFAFTGLVLNAVLAAEAGRVVTVGSNGHRMGKLDFDDLAFTQGYKPLRGYGRSKLANLLFAYELQRRLEAAGVPARSLAAHPGGANTDAGGFAGSAGKQQIKKVIDYIPNPIVHSAHKGALPILRAAVDPSTKGGEYYGPSGLLKMTGRPVVVSSNAASRDPKTAQRLWELSETLTGVTYPL